MARSPKPKEEQADGVLDDAAATDARTPDAEAGAALAGAGGDPNPPQAATLYVPTDPQPQGFRLRIRAMQPSRWRAGRHFGPEPVEIDAGRLTVAEITALQGDPLLIVEVIAPD